MISLFLAHRDTKGFIPHSCLQAILYSSQPCLAYCLYMWSRLHINASTSSCSLYNILYICIVIIMIITCTMFQVLWGPCSIFPIYNRNNEVSTILFWKEVKATHVPKVAIAYLSLMSKVTGQGHITYSMTLFDTTTKENINKRGF